MHTNPIVSPLIERHIKVKGKFFKYKVAGRTYGNDDYIISESLKEAFCLILDTYMSLKNKDAKSLRIAREILGNSNYKTLLGSIEKVELKILEKVLVILRENYLDTENDNVLASIDKDDKKTFTVYDKFFDQVASKENRAGIFIHEIAHLCDFDEEDEMRELDSAECIKNICLCINGKITLEQIKAEHKKQQQNPQKDRQNGVLTYRPNPNLRANGQFDFGPDSGSGGSSGSNSNNIKVGEKEYSKDSLNLSFDGINFKVLSDNEEVKSFKAVSGTEGYQLGKFQGEKNKGPLPEGDYIIKQSDYQKMSFKDEVLGYLNLGKFPGSTISWGNQRVWITPEDNTNTYGRSNFSIHGGSTPGSRGCIDLTNNNNEFMRIFKDSGKDLKLNVKYLDDSILEKEIIKYKKSRNKRRKH